MNLLHMIQLQRAITRLTNTQLALAIIDECCAELPADSKERMIMTEAAWRLCPNLRDEEERLNEQWLSSLETTEDHA